MFTNRNFIIRAVRFVVTLALLTVGTTAPAQTDAVVPNMYEMTQQAAINALTALGLKADVRYEYTDVQPALGHVGRQNPGAGTYLTPGSTVEITVWKMYTVVPNLYEMTQQGATNALAALGLNTDVRYTFTDVQPALGHVGGQAPPAGTYTTPGGTVEINVWKMYTVVPNLYEMTQQGATNALAALELVADVRYTFTDVQPALGHVGGQAPPAGTYTTPGGTVEINVWKMYTVVPNLYEMTQQGATNALAALELVADVRYTFTDVQPALGHVGGQAPTAGTYTTPGGTVEINVWKMYEPTPNLYEMTEQAAINALAALGLTADVQYTYTDVQPALGHVGGQTPAAGQLASSGVVEIDVWRRPPPQLQGPCLVQITAERDGQQVTKNIHQFAFPNGFEEHYGGPPGMFERFKDVVYHGELAKLEDPMTWILVAQFLSDPKGTAKGLAIDELLDEMGIELPDPQQMLLDEAGKTVGVELNDYVYTQQDLLYALVKASKTTDTSGWDKTDWNDTITQVGFEEVFPGACGNASVWLFEHDQYGGDKVGINMGYRPDLGSIGWHQETSSVRITWGAP